MSTNFLKFTKLCTQKQLHRLCNVRAGYVLYRALIIIIIIVGVEHFRTCISKNLHATCHALNLDVVIGWEVSGMILDCCRCVTGVSTNVLHSFDEVQILIW